MSKNKSLEQRVATILETYDQQGIHRTGTTGDTENAHYLAEEIKATGQKPLLNKISRILRVDPIQSGASKSATTQFKAYPFLTAHSQIKMA